MTAQAKECITKDPCSLCPSPCAVLSIHQPPLHHLCWKRHSPVLHRCCMRLLTLTAWTYTPLVCYAGNTQSRRTTHHIVTNPHCMHATAAVPYPPQ